MPIPGVHITVLRDPCTYSTEQIEHATAVASLMNRGLFVYCVPPANAPR